MCQCKITATWHSVQTRSSQPLECLQMYSHIVVTTEVPFSHAALMYASSSMSSDLMGFLYGKETGMDIEPSLATKTSTHPREMVETGVRHLGAYVPRQQNAHGRAL